MELVLSEKIHVFVGQFSAEKELISENIPSAF